SVRYCKPSSRAARTTLRTAEIPLTWPASRGRCRFFAQRPLPSMMMATCRGRRLARTAWGGAASNIGFVKRRFLVSCRQAPLLHVHDFLILGGKRVVDFMHAFVRH